MNKHLLFILIFSRCCSHYQDIIINNTILEQGSRECQNRYAPIKKVLDQYKRPITVLDIGASEGFFSFKIANDYDAVCVMIEGNYKLNSQETTAERLEKLCRENQKLEKIILLKKHISSNELKILSECEHFDVVLALNVIHHFGANWKEATDAILNLGDNIIIQTPPETDKNAAGQDYLKLIEGYLKEKDATIIGNFPRQTQKNVIDNMFRIKNNKKNLNRVHWSNSLPQERWQNYVIESDFTQKTFTKKHLNETRQWYPGINLYTFKILNGVWPERKKIYKMLEEIDFSNHNDVKIWNIIIQGQNLIPIDGDEAKWQMTNYGRLDDLNKLLENFKD